MRQRENSEKAGMQGPRMQETRKALSKNGMGTCNQWESLIYLLKCTFPPSQKRLRSGASSSELSSCHAFSTGNFSQFPGTVLYLHFPSLALSLCIVKY